jgi:hypothetical protein
MRVITLGGGRGGENRGSQLGGLMRVGRRGVQTASDLLTDFCPHRRRLEAAGLGCGCGAAAARVRAVDSGQGGQG